MTKAVIRMYNIPFFKEKEATSYLCATFVDPGGATIGVLYHK